MATSKSNTSTRIRRRKSPVAYLVVKPSKDALVIYEDEKTVHVVFRRVGTNTYATERDREPTGVSGPDTWTGVVFEKVAVLK